MHKRKPPPTDYKGLAFAFGVATSTVQKWVKQGIPHKRKKGKIWFDPDKASAWVAENSPRAAARAGYASSRKAEEARLSAAAAQKQGKSADKVPLMLDPAHLKSISENPDKMRERLEFAELFAFRLYVQSLQTNDPHAQLSRLRILADVSKAKRDLQDDEAMLAKERERVLLIVTEELQAWLEPLRALLDSAPRVLAPHCNPQDPAAAEKAVDDWVQNTVLPALSRAFAPLPSSGIEERGE